MEKQDLEDNHLVMSVFQLTPNVEITSKLMYGNEFLWQSEGC